MANKKDETQPNPYETDVEAQILEAQDDEEGEEIEGGVPSGYTQPYLIEPDQLAEIEPVPVFIVPQPNRQTFHRFQTQTYHLTESSIRIVGREFSRTRVVLESFDGNAYISNDGQMWAQFDKLELSTNEAIFVKSDNNGSTISVVTEYVVDT